MTTLAALRESDRAVITVTEAAALLEVDERTVRRACEMDQLPHVRVGVRLLILREPLLAILSPATNEVAPTTAATDSPGPPQKASA